MSTELKNKIANFIDMDIEEINEVTEAQKKALKEGTTNLFQMPKFYTDYHIIFTSESAMKHWQYYAGFEYLPEPEIMKRGDLFIAAYSTDNDSDNRIQEYLDTILNASEC